MGTYQAGHTRLTSLVSSPAFWAGALLIAGLCGGLWSVLADDPAWEPVPLAAALALAAVVGVSWQQSRAGARRRLAALSAYAERQIRQQRRGTARPPGSAEERLARVVFLDGQRTRSAAAQQQRETTMNGRRPATSDADPSVEALAAELTAAAYHVALRHAAGDRWLDLEFELWRVLTETVRKWGGGCRETDDRWEPVPAGRTGVSDGYRGPAGRRTRNRPSTASGA
jgi:hypothetical protein